MESMFNSVSSANMERDRLGILHLAVGWMLTRSLVYEMPELGLSRFDRYGIDNTVQYAVISGSVRDQRRNGNDLYCPSEGKPQLPE
jgi:hypothetical protein